VNEGDRGLYTLSLTIPCCAEDFGLQGARSLLQFANSRQIYYFPPWHKANSAGIISFHSRTGGASWASLLPSVNEQGKPNRGLISLANACVRCLSFEPMEQWLRKIHVPRKFENACHNDLGT